MTGSCKGPIIALCAYAWSVIKVGKETNNSWRRTIHHCIFCTSWAINWWLSVWYSPSRFYPRRMKQLTDNSNFYTLNSLSLFWLAEIAQRIFEISACDVITADYTIIMSRTLKVMGNHVMYDRGAWFLRVIMSSSRALCCLPSVKKQKHDFMISLSLRLRLITPTSTLIILNITKTSSNNCL